jgi:hypothetical protein
MRKLLAILSLVAFSGECVSQIADQVTPGVPAALREQISRLRTGNQVTITLDTGKKVQGQVKDMAPERMTLRIDKGFFRHRTETLPYNSIVELKKNSARWVGPVVTLAITAGVVVGVVVCVESGACSN